MEGQLSEKKASAKKAAPGRRRGSLRRMPDLLGRLLDPEAKRRGLAEATLLTEWARVIGPEIAGRCQPVSLSRDGLLHLDVSGSAALELQHSEVQVVERINTFFGRPTVRRLRLRQAPPKRRAFVPRPAPPPPLTPDDKERISETVASVDNDELRHALESLGGTLRQQKLAKPR